MYDTGELEDLDLIEIVKYARLGCLCPLTLSPQQRIEFPKLRIG
jgi:hypothetical protein